MFFPDSLVIANGGTAPDFAFISRLPKQNNTGNMDQLTEFPYDTTVPFLATTSKSFSN